MRFIQKSFVAVLYAIVLGSMAVGASFPNAIHTQAHAAGLAAKPTQTLAFTMAGGSLHPATVPSYCYIKLNVGGISSTFPYPTGNEAALANLQGTVGEYFSYNPVEEKDIACGYFYASVTVYEDAYLNGGAGGDARIYLTSAWNSGCSFSNGYLASTHIYVNPGASGVSGYSNTVYNDNSMYGYAIYASVEFIPHSGGYPNTCTQFQLFDRQSY